MKHIIISRTDSIGDVVLTLPLAGFLKSRFPDIKITFIGSRYTLPIISRSGSVDQAISKEELNDPNIDTNADAIIFAFPDIEVAKWAKRKKIKNRIGTSHRMFHFIYANRRINFSRKGSDLHEAQLNFKLLKGIGIDHVPEKRDIPDWYGLEKIDLGKDNSRPKRIILHPKSKGSAREWPLVKYYEFIKSYEENQLRFLITGTREDGQTIQRELPEFTQESNVEDLCGSSDLDGLINLISQADGLIAASTGPLHIAAAFGIPTLGLYPPLKPMDPGRWAPIGKKASFLTSKESCSNCPGGQHCPCMQNLNSSSIKEWVDNLIEKPNY